MFEVLGLRGKKPFTGPTAHLRPPEPLDLPLPRSDGPRELRL